MPRERGSFSFASKERARYFYPMMDSSASRVASLYVHVPFCAQKCAYCAFYSEASSGELVNRYVAALVREMEIVAGDLKPKTIFFGGGTPSLLNLRQWEQILRAMEKLNLLGAEEFTVECNPATVSSDKAKLFRDFGVNRVSMGVQSLDEKLLDRLGRIHSREMVFKSFDILRRAGFENLNLDLMFAIPDADDGNLARHFERSRGDAKRASFQLRGDLRGRHAAVCPDESRRIRRGRKSGLRDV